MSLRGNLPRFVKESLKRRETVCDNTEDFMDSLRQAGLSDKVKFDGHGDPWQLNLMLCQLVGYGIVWVHLKHRDGDDVDHYWCIKLPRLPDDPAELMAHAAEVASAAKQGTLRGIGTVEQWHPESLAELEI